MRMRLLMSAVLVLVGVLVFIVWRESRGPAAPRGDMPGSGAGSAEGIAPPAADDPGVEWKPPARWVEELASGMRLANYVVPASGEGGEPANCAVYYFGPGQGGGTDANIERWIGEFQDPATPKRRNYKVHGMKVAQVEVSGNYLAHTGMGGHGTGAEEGWALLGAIVEGPGGAVFFKLTGPAATVTPAAKEFDGMISSLQKK